MPVIIDMGDYWIESHFINHGFVGNGLGSNVVFSLDKPGRVVGVSDLLSLESAAPAASLNWQVTKADTTAIDVYGEELTQLESRVRNDSGIGLTITKIIMVFLKR